MCNENNEVDIEALSEALYELGKTTQKLIEQFQNATIELANIVVKATNGIVEACKETQTEEPMKSIIELAEVMRAQQNLIIDLDKIEIKGKAKNRVPFYKGLFNDSNIKYNINLKINQCVNMKPVAIRKNYIKYKRLKIPVK